MSNNTETYVIRLNDVHFMAGMRRAQRNRQTARRVSGIGGAMKIVGGIMAGISVYALGNSVVVAKFKSLNRFNEHFGDNSTAKKRWQILPNLQRNAFEVDVNGRLCKMANRGVAPTMEQMAKWVTLQVPPERLRPISQAVLDASTGNRTFKSLVSRRKNTATKYVFSFKGIRPSCIFRQSHYKLHSRSWKHERRNGASDAIMKTTGADFQT
jgi:hypothetical protein